MKDVLVVGGSYFLGRVFVETLAKRADFRVTVVNRGNRPLGLPQIREIVCDRNDTNKLTEILPKKRWDSIVDFCAYTPSDAKNFFDALGPGAADQFLFLSTASVYAATRILPVAEKAPKVSGPQPELGPAADYGYQKVLAETMCQAQCLRKSISLTILRPTIVYGPYNYAPRESWFFETIRKEKALVLPWPDLPLFQFVYAPDVAESLIRCIDDPPRGPTRIYNLSAPDLVSYGRIAQTLKEITGLSFSISTRSPEKIDSERIPLPFPLESHLIYSGDSFSKDFDFTYTSFSDGMKSTWEWYCQANG